MPITKARGLRGSTYHHLLGLLSLADIRISEARNLQSDDVDLTEGILTIRETKFGKYCLAPFMSRAVGVVTICVAA